MSITQAIDTMHDVYMSPKQREAYDLIVTAAMTGQQPVVVTDARVLVVAAVDEIKSWYPTCAFPEDGKSLDCKSASMARLTADNVLKQFDELTAALQQQPTA